MYPVQADIDIAGLKVCMFCEEFLSLFSEIGEIPLAEQAAATADAGHVGI